MIDHGITTCMRLIEIMRLWDDTSKISQNSKSELVCRLKITPLLQNTRTLYHHAVTLKHLGSVLWNICTWMVGGYHLALSQLWHHITAATPTNTMPWCLLNHTYTYAYYERQRGPPPLMNSFSCSLQVTCTPTFKCKCNII